MQLLKVHPESPSLELVHKIPGPALLGAENVTLLRKAVAPFSTIIPVDVVPPPVMVPLFLTWICDPPSTLM